MRTLAPRRPLWLAAALPPLFFLLALVAASVWFGAQGLADPRLVEQRVVQSMPAVLLAVQVMLLLLLLGLVRRERLGPPDLGWRADRPGREVLIGALVGAALAGLYVYLLSPLLVWLQTHAGDYVPAGELRAVWAGMPGLFLLANVALAPAVEETLYRGYLLRGLAVRLGRWPALGLSCLAFGLLHWAGGLWYVLATGLVAGGIFGGLFLWRRTLIAAFVAHLTLNLLEFAWVAG